MSRSSGIVFCGPETEFKELVKALPSLYPPVTVDAAASGRDGLAACFLYNMKNKFFLSRSDEFVEREWAKWTVVAAVILVMPSDAKNTVKVRLEQVEKKFGSMPIAIYSKKHIKIEGLNEVLDVNTLKSLPSFPTQMVNSQKSVSGEFALRLLSHTVNGLFI
jgi:hypothetical protein